MYSKEAMKRFTDPSHAGEMKDADAVGEEGNVKCGDVMRIYLKIKDNRIEKISFLTYGCVAAIASTDALCSLAEGKSLEEAEKIGAHDIAEELGELPPIKIHCSVLGHQALRRAIDEYRKKKDESESKKLEENSKR